MRLPWVHPIVVQARFQLAVRHLRGFERRQRRHDRLKSRVRRLEGVPSRIVVCFCGSAGARGCIGFHTSYVPWSCPRFIHRRPDCHVIPAWYRRARGSVPIWNALVLEATGDSSFIEEARRMLAPLRTSSGASPLEVLVRRKRTHFANDLRLVGPWHLYPDGDDGFRLQATALAPPTLR